MNLEHEIPEIQKRIEKDISRHLKQMTPYHPIQEVYQYSVLPAGKLFRPLLVWSVAKDLKNESENHSYFASFVEIHHAYTLVHDDLPCMDDDDMRRGRATTHKQFGEWQALLVGDGLQAASYALLSKITHPRMDKLFRFCSWALGPKGLIHGQVLDLTLEMNKDFKTLLRTHELKTGRLLMTSILGSALISMGDTVDLKLLKKLYRLSNHLGLTFQLLDDYSELSDYPLSQHEQDINPILRYSEKSLEQLENSLCFMKSFFQEYQFPMLKTVIQGYFEIMKDKFQKGQENRSKNLAELSGIKDFEAKKIQSLLTL